MKLYNFEKEENNWDEREEGWPMLRIVIPNKFALPKALQTTNFVCCLAFLMLTCLREQALDAVRIKKASQLC